MNRNRSALAPAIALASLAILLFALAPASAHEGHHHHMGAKTGAKTTTVTGEVVDTGCYLADGERGPDHTTCATRCITRGMPMSLVTTDDTVYLLTMNHDNADPYNQLKKMAGLTVSVSGTMLSRGGMKAIDVTAVHTAAQ